MMFYFDVLITFRQQGTSIFELVDKDYFYEKKIKTHKGHVCTHVNHSL